MALITCSECGKQISDKAEKCPGCGYENNKNYNTQQSTDGLSIAGFVLGIIAISFDLLTGILLFFVTDIVAIVGLVLSIVGINSSKKSNKKGHNLAITGTILTSITLFLQLMRFLFVAAYYM